MPIDPDAQRLLRMVGAGARAGTTRVTIEERRRSFEALMRLGGAGVPVGSIENRTCEGPGGPLGLRLYTAEGSGAGALPGLVYFHGGGLVAGSLDTHDALCRILCAAISCRLVAVDYRLAPEHPFPAAIEDALAAVRWVLDHAPDLGIDPDRIGIGGDSAGATLAAVVTQRLRASGQELRCQLLLCPVLDFGERRESKCAFAQGYLLDQALMDRDLEDYAPGLVDLSDPLISPLRGGDLSGLPRAFIHTAEFDPLRDEGQAYADRLAAAGVEVDLTCHAGMVHHFYGLSGLIPAGRAILASIGAEVAAALTA